MTCLKSKQMEILKPNIHALFNFFLFYSHTILPLLIPPPPSLRFTSFLKRPSLRLRALRGRRQRQLSSTTCGCTAPLFWASCLWWCLWGSNMWTSWRWSSWPASSSPYWLFMLESSRAPSTRRYSREWLFLYWSSPPLIVDWLVTMTTSVVFLSVSASWEIARLCLKDTTSVQRSSK